MSINGLERLTERERAALRLVPTHRSLHSIATTLGVSQSAVKERLENAAKKLGVRGRFEAARTLIDHEGWPPRSNGVPPNERVEAPPKSGPTEGHRSTTDSVAEFREERTTYVASPQPAPRRWTLLTPVGGIDDVRPGSRFALIVLTAFLCLALLSLVLVAMAELGRVGISLSDHGIKSI